MDNGRAVAVDSYTGPGARYCLKYLGVLCVLLFLASCASVPPKVPPSGVSHLNASWYGPKFHGKPTSSGEIFNMYSLTCAHRELPFGTRLRVTNPRNNKSVIVTVNDRGPFIAGRDIDLSYAAAKNIGLLGPGVGVVRVEILGRDARYVKKVAFLPSAPSGPYTIQAGSFRDESNAHRLKQGLELNYDGVYITTAYINGEKFYRVRIGTFKSKNPAYALAEKLAGEGYSTLIIAKD